MSKLLKRSLRKRVKKWNRKFRSLKIKIVLLIILPVAIICIANAVIKEYTKIKLKETAVSVPETPPTQSPQ